MMRPATRSTIRCAKRSMGSNPSRSWRTAMIAAAAFIAPIGAAHAFQAAAAPGSNALKSGALDADTPTCAVRRADARRYVVCIADPQTDDLRLFHASPTGEPLKTFDAVDAMLSADGDVLSFAMNAGMYDRARRPIGLYVENGKTLKRLNQNAGPGNFHLMPNGVFAIVMDKDPSGAQTRRALVAPSAAFAKGLADGVYDVVYATQSGPMLVIDGAFHPRFLPQSTSRKRRNGVGVGEDGKAVFVLSDNAVTFYEFAAFFRDHLGVANALFLDGTISRVHAPDLARSDGGLPMGPIVGVVVKEKTDRE